MSETYTLDDIIKAIFDAGGIERNFDGAHWVSFALVLGFHEEGWMRSTGGYLYADDDWWSCSVKPRSIRQVVESYEQSVRPPVRGDHEENAS